MTAESDDISIGVADRERLDDLRSIWESLSEHHVQIAPQLRALGPIRPPAESWDVRRAHYRALFEDFQAFVCIAQVRSAAVGYALAQLRGPEESWETGRVAVLETLAVLPDHRHRGIGTALVRSVMAELRVRGIGHWEVTTIASNEEAIRFYERLDLLPFAVTYIGGVPAEAGVVVTDDSRGLPSSCPCRGMTAPPTIWRARGSRP